MRNLYSSPTSLTTNATLSLIRLVLCQASSDLPPGFCTGSFISRQCSLARFLYGSFSSSLLFLTQMTLDSGVLFVHPIKNWTLNFVSNAAPYSIISRLYRHKADYRCKLLIFCFSLLDCKLHEHTNIESFCLLTSSQYLENCLSQSWFAEINIYWMNKWDGKISNLRMKI